MKVSRKPSPSRRPQKPRIERRAVHGVLLLDKPGGQSSNAALQKARNLFRAHKAGHTGSLDPLATGMLPVCFGEATKMSTFLLASDKAYSTVARLGVITDSGDSDGEVVEKRDLPDPLTAELVESRLAELRGPIKQVPPMYSALKHQGQRLYKLAREGKTVEREARPVTIHALELKHLASHSLSLDVTCSKGTYIRTLVEDLGQSLGCGAHIEMLRRAWVAPYKDLPMWTLDALQELLTRGGEAALDQCLLPLDSALEHLPSITLNNAECGLFGNGGAITLTDCRLSGLISLPVTMPATFKVYSETTGFLGIAELHPAESGPVQGHVVSEGGGLVILRPKKVLNL